MTEDQKNEMKVLCYTHWLLCRAYNTEYGLRDSYSLKDVVVMPAGSSLTCLLGEKLTNKKDLFTQLGWFLYYLIEGEPFNSKNKALAILILFWCLEYYKLSFDEDKIINFVMNIDTMRIGNTDISFKISELCK